MPIGLSSQVNATKVALMKQYDQKSAVMKSASSAATRTGSWSSAKQDFAHRATTAGSVADKAPRTNAKRVAGAALTNRKK